MGRARIYPYTGRRARFTGTFVRYSQKKYETTPTAILTDVRDHRGELVADHCWFTKVAPFVEVGVVEGDIIAFDACVRLMVRGYYEHDRHLPIEKHYHLEEARHVRIIERVGETPVPKKTKRTRFGHRQHRRPRYPDEYENEEEDV